MGTKLPSALDAPDFPQPSGSGNLRVDDFSSILEADKSHLQKAVDHA